MFEMDMNQMNLEEVKALVKVTEEFVALATELLEKGNIVQEEYENMTQLKIKFLNDVKARYLE